MKILLYCQFSEGYNEAFRKRISEIAPDAELNYYDDNNWSPEEYHKKLEEAEVIIGHFKPDDLQYCKNLKLIQMDIEGVDAYVKNPYLPDETIICNAGGSYGKVVAEHAVALAMALCRDIHIYAENRLQRKWKINIPDKAIEGSTVTILGAGDIGCTAAQILRPLADRIIGVRRVVRDKPEVFDEMVTLDEIEKYLPQTDILICALPGTPLTKGFLNAERMRLLKEDAVLVNVGRGTLIPMDDLAQVLSEGKLRGAGIDVFEKEPLPDDHPLWSCSNIIITPHSAGNAMAQSSPTNTKIFNLIYSNLAAYIAGQPLKAVVDKTTGYRKTKT